MLNDLAKAQFEQYARQVFARTKYGATEEDVQALAQNMALVEDRGLGDLNKRLKGAKTKVFDTIAEHNVASMLLRHCGAFVQVAYEPLGYAKRPVDFRVQINHNTFWLQMRRPADLERENRHNHMLAQIERAAGKIRICKFFDCELRDDFNKKTDLPQLVQFLEATAPTSAEGVQYDYPTSVNVKARVQFWEPRNASLQGLTLGSAGDMGMIDITNLSADQMRASIRNSAGAFIHAVDGGNINLVLAEADNLKDIDVGEACFGTEQEVFSAGTRRWSRQNNGVFVEADLAKNLAGVVVCRRLFRRQPISDYMMLLYINEKHTDYLLPIQAAFPVQKVIHYYMRPDQTGYF